MYRCESVACVALCRMLRASSENGKKPLSSPFTHRNMFLLSVSFFRLCVTSP